MVSSIKSKVTLFTFVGICISSYTFAQISIKNELKKDLLKDIRPGNGLTSSPSLMKQDDKVISKKSVFDLDINRINIEDYNPYKINPNAYTYFGITPLILDPRQSVTVYEGGHFKQAMPTKGIGVSFWEPKKVSEKDKNILKNVFDHDVDKK